MREREKIGRSDHEHAACAKLRRERAIVAHVAVGARVLQEHRERIRVGARVRGADVDGDAERRGARAHDVDRLREDIVGDEEPAARRIPRAQRERHRFRGGRAFVEHRRVRDVHAGEIAHHRLEVDERLQTALRDLGLVRRVGRVPGRVLEDIAQDDARRVRAVVALADERLRNPVARGDRLELGERSRLRHRTRERDGRGFADRRRHDRVHQRAARRVAERREHRGLVVGRGSDVARAKCGCVFQFQKLHAINFSYAAASSMPASASGSAGLMRNSHAAYASSLSVSGAAVTAVLAATISPAMGA